jgi:hypothetical protein
MPRYSCFLADCLPDGDEGLAFDAAGLRVAPGVEVQLGSTPSHRLVRDVPHRTRFLGGYPLVWVSDPVTGFAAPYWAPRDWAAALSRLRPGAAGQSLPAQLARALHAVGALVDPAASPDQSRPHPLAGAAAQFEASCYATVSGLTPPGHLLALGRYQRALIGSGRVPLGDAQCHRRYGMHNEPIARFFLHQLRPAISRIVGKPVMPAYTYSVTYEGGAVLAAHTDREQCEYTVSLLVDVTGDAESEPWPLWLQADGEPVAVRQLPGDALLFAGRRLRHWRDRLPDGRTSTSLLLHYVDEGFTGSLS